MLWIILQNKHARADARREERHAHERVGNLEFTFGLVEMGLYRQASTSTLFVQPRVLVRTEIVSRSIVSVKEGVVEIEENTGDGEETSELNEDEKWYLDFWTEFKDQLILDDPDQPISKPNRFGNLYFAMPPSGSVAWVSVYFLRAKNEVGIYLRFRKGNLAERFSEALLNDREAILEELGAGAECGEDKNRNFTIWHTRNYEDLRSPSNCSEIKQFFSEKANLYVNTFRPRLMRLSENSSD